MATIVPQFNPGAYIGQGFSQGLEKGVSSGLEALQKLHMEDMLARQKLGRQKEQFKGTPFEGLEGLEPTAQAAAIRSQADKSKQLQQRQFWTNLLPKDTDPSVIESFINAPAPVQAAMAERLDLSALNNIPQRTEGEPSEPTETEEKVSKPLFGPSKEERKFQQAEKVENYRKINKEFDNLSKSYQSIVELSTKLDKAEKIASLIQKQGNWPSAGFSFLTPEAKEAFYRKPHVQELRSLLNDIVITMSQARKGLPSNYKVKMEAAAKPALEMPYDDFKARIEGIRGTNEPVIDRFQFFNKQKDAKTGRFNENTLAQLQDFDASRTNPLKYPQFFPEGQMIRHPKTKKILIKGKSDWEDYNV
jgi:hypothetical protein